MCVSLIKLILTGAKCCTIAVKSRASLQIILEVAPHDADALLRAELLEKVAGSAAIAGQVVDGADCCFFFINQVRASYAFRLYDHLLLWVYCPVRSD